MAAEQCLWGVCFIPLESNGQTFFGFSEFLTGLALMILAWTIADVRYRFRVQTAPIPLMGITFSVVTAVGILTLLTDLWRAEQWIVLKSNVMTLALWQAILGGLFFLTFLTWTWFAFIRPPIYGRHNADRFMQTLYRFILKGSPAELAVIADELAYSAAALVHHATDNRIKRKKEEKKNPPKVEGYANDLLLLIADRRLCRAIVESSPGTALAIFREMGETKKHGIQIKTFAKNIINESIANKDSFLFHEAEGYQSGLIGYYKPLSQAMFANYSMVETVGTMLDPELSKKREWDAAQWEAYCRVVLMTFRNYVEEGYGGHSSVLIRAVSNIKDAVSELYKLNGAVNSAWDDDLLARLRAIVKFIKDVVEILEEKGVPDYLQMRIRDKNNETFYDHIASLIFEVVSAVSAVTSPNIIWIQYDLVWRRLFNVFDGFEGRAGAIVRFKVRRLLYNEIAAMKRFPDFKRAKILGFCLNVMGFTIKQSDYYKDSRALHKAVLTWTKKNYVWLHGYNQRIAEKCLVDGMTYDVDNRRLVRTYPVEGIRREPSHVYLELDPVPPELEAETATR